MKKPNHLERFPCLMPWVGDAYADNRHKRLLIVGESHYMPKESTIQLDREAWYNKSENDLTCKERSWINTQECVRENGCEECDPRFLWGKMAEQITYVSEKKGLTLGGQCVFDHVAFCNYFMIPAPKTGGGMTNYVTQQDRVISEEVLRWVISEHAPELVLFISKLAFWNGGQGVVDEFGVPYEDAPHPNTTWWNRTAKAYGGKKGCELFADFLMEHWVTP